MIAGTIRRSDEVKAELDALRARKKARKSRQRPTRDHYGLVHLDPDGYCRIFYFHGGEEKALCLGRSVEVIPFLRDQGIDGNDLDAVMNALGKKASEKVGTEKCRGNHPQKRPVSPPNENRTPGKSKEQGFIPPVSVPIVTGAKNRLKCLSQAHQGLVKADMRE